MPNENWKRVTPSHPCPICRRPNAKHKSCWCLLASDGTAVICPFTPEGAERNLGAAGYLHRLNGPYRGSGTDGERPRARASGQLVRWDVLSPLYERAAPCEAVPELANTLGVSPISLWRLNIGRCDETVWTFPMRDAQRRIVGIRTRTEDGTKRAIRGSRNGLFIPQDHPVDNGSPLLICEGPTDTAAALTLRFSAVGRADCNHERYVAEHVAGRPAVVVADRDVAGQAGAQRLARNLRVGVFTPPAKDLRAWLVAGAIRENVLAAIAKATHA